MTRIVVTLISQNIWSHFVWDSETQTGITYFMDGRISKGRLVESALDNWLAEFPDAVREVSSEALVDIGL